MITFPALGRYGRLGNQLFQMAATIGAAIDAGDEYGFPRWEHEGRFPVSGCFLDALPEGSPYQEPHFSHDPIPKMKSLRLHGYFQSEKYFARHASLIRKLLSPSVVVPERPDAVSVHVRRGDYMLLPTHHPILPMSYFLSAAEALERQGARRFLVFSDDLPWCREQAVFSRPPFEIIPDMGPLEQLALTISCTHHIMANSTFSWWAAWLDPKPGKIIVAPRLWFGPGYAHFDTKDLIPDGWLVL